MSRRRARRGRMVGRLVDARTRRGRRLTWAALGVAGAAIAVVAVLARHRAERGRPRRRARARRRAATRPGSRRAPRATRSGLGSGWVLDGDAGLVVTAAHVVNRGERFFVTADGRESEATVVGVAPVRRPRGPARRERASGASRSPLAGGDAEQGAVRARLRLPRDRHAGRARVVHARRRLRREHLVPRPGARTSPPTPTRSAPTRPSIPASPAARSSTSTGSVAGVNAAARRTGADGRPLQGANYAVSADRARARARRPAPRALARPGSAPASATRARATSRRAGCRPASGSRASSRAPAPTARGPRRRVPRRRRRPPDGRHALGLVPRRRPGSPPAPPPRSRSPRPASPAGRRACASASVPRG